MYTKLCNNLFRTTFSWCNKYNIYPTYTYTLEDAIYILKYLCVSYNCFCKASLTGKPVECKLHLIVYLNRLAICICICKCNCSATAGSHRQIYAQLRRPPRIRYKHVYAYKYYSAPAVV